MKALIVTLTVTHDGRPLAVIDGLPGDGAELRPDHLRALAGALLNVAADAQARRAMHRGKPLPPERRAYPLEADRAGCDRIGDRRLTS